MTIGDRIRSRRAELGVTQSQLAQALRDTGNTIHQADVSNWERGTTPSTPVLVPLADALRVDLRWLLSGEGEGPSESAAKPAVDLAPAGTDPG